VRQASILDTHAIDYIEQRWIYLAESTVAGKLAIGHRFRGTHRPARAERSGKIDLDEATGR
jgi:hypothetical protein